MINNWWLVSVIFLNCRERETKYIPGDLLAAVVLNPGCRLGTPWGKLTRMRQARGQRKLLAGYS